MSKRSERNFLKRIGIDIAGFGLIIAAPFLGWLPGPGGIPIFLAGLGLLALNYDWAENLLKNFEKKRVEFTKRYLTNNPRVSRSIDAVSTLMIVFAIYLLFTQQALILRGIGIALISLSGIIIISNQNRLDRIIASIKKIKHKQ